MAKLPEPINATVSRIYESYEAENRASNDDLRAHLGASIIGRFCDRELWLTFRWAERKDHSGRILRLFQTGSFEEPRFTADLRRIGVEVHETDPTGSQWRVNAYGNHFGGSMDAAGVGFPEAPKTWHVVEYKTHGEKSFKELQEKQVRLAKPEHYAQMQIYMGLTGMDRAAYLAKNKNTDELYFERIEFDQDAFKKLMDRAKRIITAPEPPARCAQDPSYYKCKQCDFKSVCWNAFAPLVNCRTCAFSTPELDGEQRWSCSKHNADSIPLDAQREGCDEHRYIPQMLDRIGRWESDGSEEVRYVMPNGQEFRNGMEETSYTSKEMRSLGEHTAMLGERLAKSIKKAFSGARFVPEEMGR